MDLYAQNGPLRNSLLPFFSFVSLTLSSISATSTGVRSLLKHNFFHLFSPIPPSRFLDKVDCVTSDSHSKLVSLLFFFHAGGAAAAAAVPLYAASKSAKTSLFIPIIAAIARPRPASSSPPR